VVEPQNRPDIFDLIEKCSKLLNQEPPVTRPNHFSKFSGIKKVNPPPKPTPQPVVVAKKQTPSGGGGGLFDQLDWSSNSESNNSSQTVVKQEQSNNVDGGFDDGFDDFNVDFSSLERQTSKKQVMKPPSPIQVVAQKKSSTTPTSGGGLFDQLDWSDNSTTNVQTTKPKSVATPTASKNASLSNSAVSFGNSISEASNSQIKAKTHVKQASFDKTPVEVKNTKQVSFGSTPSNTSSTDLLWSDNEKPKTVKTETDSNFLSQLDWNISSPNTPQKSPQSAPVQKIEVDPFGKGHSKQPSFTDDIFGSYDTAKSMDPKTKPNTLNVESKKKGHLKQPSFSDALDLYGNRSISLDFNSPSPSKVESLHVKQPSFSGEITVTDDSSLHQRTPSNLSDDGTSKPKGQITVKDKRIQLIKAITDENSEIPSFNVNSN
jgi:hypothetical protein